MTDEPIPEGLRIARAVAAAKRAERNGNLAPVPDLAPEPPDNPGPPDGPTTPVLADRLLTRAALRSLPTPEPLIDNVLDQGTTALLYGKWGTAKTFIALDWAASVATGRPWQGRDTSQRRVLYVAAEGAFGFQGRVDAWEVGWRREIDDQVMMTLPEPVNLTRPAEVDQLRALVEWGQFSFVVLDTLARCMVGGDENSAKDCGIVVDAMTKVRDSTPGRRGVVLGVHHPGKDGKTLRGSTAFEGGADTVYFTSRDGEVITLERQKRKDGPEKDTHQLKLDLMPGTDSGVMIRSSALPPLGGNSERADQLFTTFSQSFGGTGATRAELRSVAMDAGMSNASFYRALSDLLKAGRLTNEGTDKRPFYPPLS